jgi:hypothetical protein
LKTYKYDRGEFDLADVGERVIYIRDYIEGDNTDRYGHRGVKIGRWYDVLEVTKSEVGNEKFTNPYRYKIKVNNLGIENYDYTRLSAFQFMSEREWRESQINKLKI